MPTIACSMKKLKNGMIKKSIYEQASYQKMKGYSDQHVCALIVKREVPCFRGPCDVTGRLRRLASNLQRDFTIDG
jgi:hypothetical protein